MMSTNSPKTENSLSEALRLSDGILTLFRNEGGKRLEISGHEWIDN